MKKGDDVSSTTKQPKIDEIFDDEKKGTEKEEKKSSDEDVRSEKDEKRTASAGPDSLWKNLTKLCRRIAADPSYNQKTAIVKDFIENGTSGGELTV